MEKKISKIQKMYPHHFGCSQNHPKAQKWGFLALLGDFGYSQNGGGTFSNFLIFFSPLLYLLITTSSSLKLVDKYPKSCPQVTQNPHFGSPFLSPWVSRRIFTFGSGLWGSYQRYNDDMRSFCDFSCFSGKFTNRNI